MATRHFPPPWSVEDIDAAFVVKDSSGQKLAYVYYEEELGGFNTTAMSRRRFAAVGRLSSLKLKAAVGSPQRPPCKVVR